MLVYFRVRACMCVHANRSTYTCILHIYSVFYNIADIGRVPLMRAGTQTVFQGEIAAVERKT